MLVLMIEKKQQTSNTEHRMLNIELRNRHSELGACSRKLSELDAERQAKYGFDDIWILAHTLL